mmetsp:Transcript_53497/g.114246  ORF Transcript_53497/g.114246 Transcript_53497/m.114246 type:complete len:206 (-) Transcript_53497:1575-2192(-)
MLALVSGQPLRRGNGVVLGGGGALSALAHRCFDSLRVKRLLLGFDLSAHARLGLLERVGERLLVRRVELGGRLVPRNDFRRRNGHHELRLRLVLDPLLDGRRGRADRRGHRLALCIFGAEIGLLEGFVKTLGRILFGLRERERKQLLALGLGLASELGPVLPLESHRGFELRLPDALRLRHRRLLRRLRLLPRRRERGLGQLLGV